jgi:hypothetical protein
VITYRSIDGVPGQYFDCPSGMGCLSANACGRAYSEAMSPVGLKEGRRITCRACPVGAQHAGVPTEAASVSRFVGSSCCSRCHGDARRLIRGSICVSCFNREREYLIGKNAKGGKPIHAKTIGSEVITCLIGSSVQVRKMDKVASPMECVLSVLRSESRTVFFSWVGASPIVGV